MTLEEFHAKLADARDALEEANECGDLEERFDAAMLVVDLEEAIEAMTKRSSDLPHPQG